VSEGGGHPLHRLGLAKFFMAAAQVRLTVYHLSLARPGYSLPPSLGSVAPPSEGHRLGTILHLDLLSFIGAYGHPHKLRLLNDGNATDLPPDFNLKFLHRLAAQRLNNSD
jgi:hypothetical protein